MGDDEDKPDEEDDEDKPDDEEDEKCDPKDEDCEKPDGEEDEDKPDDEDDEDKPDEEDDEDKPDDEEDKPEDDEEKPDEEEDEEPEEPPFDPSVCPDPKHPVSWLANKYMKEMFTSNNAKFYQVNVPISKVDNIDVVNNGDLTVAFFDTANLLEGGDVFKREEKGKQNAVVQFKVNKGDGDTAKAKVDQFWLSINGFGDVSFGNKDLSACMEAMVVGVTEGTYEGELGCIAYGKNFFG